MFGFNFEKNLFHQSQAVDSTLAVFDRLNLLLPTEIEKNYINPEFDYLNGKEYSENIRRTQEINGIKETIKRNSNIVDIMMETGTGKTYTYTKTIFELNKNFGIYKFIIVVPTLSIKAGTIDFLKSDSSREHFKEQYGKILQLHIVESQKNNKNKKSNIPPAISSFVNSGSFEKNSIQVLIINAGMVNSETLQKSYDKRFFDKYNIPIEAIANTKSLMIIDEPHKFAQENKTWENIIKMKPQFILRYGATFNKYENLIYKLSAVDSFQRNLVKGIIGHIEEFKSGENAIVKFIDSDGKEARFDLIENDKRKSVKITKDESLHKIHSAMIDLNIEKLNKSKILLSNGIELNKGDSINPYSYAEKIQVMMIQKAIKHHFEIEKSLLTRDVKIKPLTLFFIDNINEYRNNDGSIKKTLEECVIAEIKESLKSEKDVFYKSYLEKTLIDPSKVHAGYFSKDNEEKDEVIEKEINEILHDKKAMLDLDNPRRFIFSKWTLREGWDNPNVFQICKLRSSGSETSKLQEVGRGLRLPVNEYGNRVKDEQFYLNYFVDFTEKDFVEKLIKEINEKSDVLSIDGKVGKLSDEMIDKICEEYKKDKQELLIELDTNNVIDRANNFKENGFNYIRLNYPQIFKGVNSNKIRNATEIKKKISIRIEKYQELKELWEKINEKVILEYKFNSENQFKELFTEFLIAQIKSLQPEGTYERISKIEIKDNRAIENNSESVLNQKTIAITNIKYSDFLKELSLKLNVNINTIHESIIDSKIEINKFLNHKTIRFLKENFDYFLMANAFDKYSIEYKNVTNKIHPTKLTDANGNVLNEILASDVGVKYSSEKVSENYLFDKLFYDSDLEKDNIKTNIKEVVIFTKIPSKSIKIPIAGGKTYSPDFAYVLKLEDGEEKLYFIIETKNVDSNDELRNEEKFKIKHAEKFFKGKVKIEFRTQLSNNRIAELIKKITTEQENKKLNFSEITINEIKSQDSSTVDILTEYLEDKNEDKKTIKSDKFKQDVITPEKTSKVDNNLSYSFAVNFNQIQSETLILFYKNSLRISNNELESFCKSKGVFKNNLIDSINEICFEALGDVIIDEIENFYVLNESYSKKLLKIDGKY